MQKKQKVMIFKCVGSFVKNAPNCNESITTNINDDRINKSGGYETELWGKKDTFLHQDNIPVMIVKILTQDGKNK